MSFLTRFFIVTVWLLGTGASAFAVTKRCAKTEKTILRTSIHTTHKKHQPTGSHEKAVSCAGTTVFFNKYSPELVILQPYRVVQMPGGFIVPAPLSGFIKLLYSPPR